MSGREKFFIFLAVVLGVLVLAQATVLAIWWLPGLFRQEEERTRVVQVPPVRAPQEQVQSATPPATGLVPPSRVPSPPVPPGMNRDPFEEIRRMQEEMNRLFDDEFRQFQMPQIGRPPRLDREDPFRRIQDRINRMFHEQPFGSLGDIAQAPRLDLEETATHYVATLRGYGLEPEGVQVELKDNLLTFHIRQGQQQERRDSQGEFFRQFRGEFTQSVTLPGPIKPEEMEIDQQDEIITVIIPKAE